MHGPKFLNTLRVGIRVSGSVRSPHDVSRTRSRLGTVAIPIQSTLSFAKYRGALPKIKLQCSSGLAVRDCGASPFHSLSCAEVDIGQCSRGLRGARMSQLYVRAALRFEHCATLNR